MLFFTVLLQAFIQQFIVDILVLLNFCSNMNIFAAICRQNRQKLRAFQIFRKNMECMLVLCYTQEIYQNIQDVHEIKVPVLFI